jgi:hypothetical protein
VGVSLLAPNGYVWKKDCNVSSGLRVIHCGPANNSTSPNTSIAWGTGTFASGVRPQQPFGCKYYDLTMHNIRAGTVLAPVEQVDFGAFGFCDGGATIASMETQLRDAGTTGRTLANGTQVSAGTNTLVRSIGQGDLDYGNYPEGRRIQTVLLMRVVAPEGRTWQQFHHAGMAPCAREDPLHILVRCDGINTRTLDIEIRTLSVDAVDEKHCFTDNRTLVSTAYDVAVTPHIRWCAWSPREDSPGWQNGWVANTTRDAPTDVERITFLPCDLQFNPPGIDPNPLPSFGVTSAFKVQVKYKFPGCEGPLVLERFTTVDRIYHADGRVTINDRPEG